MREDYNQRIGRIFNIQRFSIHDGPGIRTIIFLKGCALRCRWCCNPESQEFGIQRMTTGGQQKTVGEDIDVGSLMQEILKDRVYYRRSGGGVTLSGGECLCQHEFSRDLLCACKEAGINTAVESTGYAEFEKVEALLPHLDYFLYDIKHMNAVKHKEFTGVSNERIIENARRLAKTGIHMTVRVPVIPEFNGTENEIQEIVDFVKTLPSVRKIHLLPYHRLGQDKYEGLNRDYLLQNILPPDKEMMEKLLEVCMRAGLDGQIGG